MYKSSHITLVKWTKCVLIFDAEELDDELFFFFFAYNDWIYILSLNLQKYNLLKG